LIDIASKMQALFEGSVTIIGNVAFMEQLQAAIRGKAGERFLARNSETNVVVEGSRRPWLRVHDRRKRGDLLERREEILRKGVGIGYRLHL